MQLRAYLLIFSNEGCESSVHRDLESLFQAWQPYLGENCITGVIHVGFSRPETNAFVACVKRFPGRMVLTASARWSLMSVCKCAPTMAGEADAIPLFVALNGWGYEASAEELELSDSTADGQVSESTTLENIAIVGEKDRLQSIDQILLCSVDDLDLTVRASNCLKAEGIFYIGELIQWTEYHLQKIQNMGRKSVTEITLALARKGLTLGTEFGNGLPFNADYITVNRDSEIEIPVVSRSAGSRNLSAENPIEIIRVAPPWILSVALTDLGLRFRTLNALNKRGYYLVRDIAKLPHKILLSIPNFGLTSSHDLANQLNLAIGRGPESMVENHENSHLEERIASSPLIDPAIKLNSQFNFMSSLASAISSAVSSLPPKISKVVRARMGLDSEPMTLREIGEEMGITRERVRQLESKGMAQIGCDSVWSGILGKKLVKLLDGREDPLPFSGLSILDDWFIGIENMEAPFSYLLGQADILNHRFSLLQINGQLFLSRLSQDEWNKTVKQAMRILEDGVNDRWNVGEARLRVEDLISDRGSELRSELWFVAKQFANFSSPHIDSDPTLVSYGHGAEALVEAILSESDRPLHYSEIPHRIAERYGKEVNVRRAHSAALEVALLYSRGFYGLLKHCPLNHQEREMVCEEVLGGIISDPSYRQWSCAELIVVLNERDLGFEGRLNNYTLNIALRDSSEIMYLGRFLWSQSAIASSRTSPRIDIRQAVASLLIRAGRPLSRAEIKNELQRDRGINHTFQIHPGGSIISVGEGLWGLIERDLPLNITDQTRLIAILQKMLRDKNSGIHVSEIMPCLEAVFEPAASIKDPTIVFAVAQRSGLMRKSTGGYLYLAEWGEPRRLNPPQAILEAFRRASVHGLTLNEILKSTSTILGHEITRMSLYSYLSSIARFDEVKKLWVISDSVDELDDESLA